MAATITLYRAFFDDKPSDNELLETIGVGSQALTKAGYVYNYSDVYYNIYQRRWHVDVQSQIHDEEPTS